MSDVRNGLILRGIGGFYTVETQQGLVECRARGVFRKLGVTPLAGDRVSVAVSPDGAGAVEEIFPRRNSLPRPPVANIDRLGIVVSTCEPNPNLTLADRSAAEAEAMGIEPFLVFSKTDLRGAEELRAVYAASEIPVFCVSPDSGGEIARLREFLRGRITAFTGNTGVGKSTLLNELFAGLNLQSGEISRKLGRGRHTTRSVELFRLESGGYVIDTPGFSSLGEGLSEALTPDNLAECFREFRPYLSACRFGSCTHTCEAGCAVLQAVSEGKISPSRHESYCRMYQEMKERKPWLKKEKHAQ